VELNDVTLPPLIPCRFSYLSGAILNLQSLYHFFCKAIIMECVFVAVSHLIINVLQVPIPTQQCSLQLTQAQQAVRV
jgi:hypothetical protein